MEFVSLGKTAHLDQRPKSVAQRQQGHAAEYQCQLFMRKTNVQKELHCVFVDLEKAYDKVPREGVWYCMRKSGLAEKYVRIV